MANAFDDLLRDLQRDYARSDEARKQELLRRVAEEHARLDKEYDAMLARMQASDGRTDLPLAEARFAANRDVARRLWPAVGQGSAPHALMLDFVRELDRPKYDEEMARLASLLGPALAGSRKDVLLREGQFFWQYCEFLGERDLGFNQTQ